MDDIKIKQEVVEKIQSSANILITVSKDPSVDALSAALGLTLALDKMDKYATAIYSGVTPPAISFLSPEKTFENNIDSLRDFIIALNKEKADHLRFKPEGDYVKIFITPYKTTIKPEDLEFSQGDFNVELIIALGVDNQEDLDGALASQGQILHDATVVTMTAGDQTSTLGGIDWHDTQVSSLSEMVTGLAEALKSDKTATLIDGPVATALLTGIVAQTDRFSNAHTTSKVMTVAANLMAAGADQQLIAAKLQQSHEISGGDAAAPTEAPSEDVTATADGLSINHDETSVASQPAAPATEAPAITVTNAYGLDAEATVEPTQAEAPVTPAETTPVVQAVDTPVEEDTSNRAYIAPTQPTSAYALDDSATNQPQGFPGTPEVAPGSVGVNDPSLSPSLVHDAYAPEAPATTEVTPAPEPTPVAPPPIVPAPADLGLPMPPPLPDFSAVATPPPALPIKPPSESPDRLGDILAPEVSPATPAAPAGPAQFKIPGQL